MPGEKAVDHGWEFAHFEEKVSEVSFVVDVLWITTLYLDLVGRNSRLGQGLS